MDTKSSYSPRTVSVIISHLNSARTIERCICSILDQDFPQDQIEIIVVDGGSKDGSTDIVQKIDSPNVRQFIVPNCTESEGHSIGIYNAKNDIIMITNSDIYVPTDWVRNHLEWLNRGYDAVGGAAFWGGDKYTFTWNAPRFKGPKFNAEDGTALAFNNTSMRREFYFRMGGFHKMLSFHDGEFTTRIVKNGANIVVDPKIEVYHDHPQKSVKQLHIRAFRYSLFGAAFRRSLVRTADSSSLGLVMLSLRSSFGELLYGHGVKVYYEYRDGARRRKIDPGLLDFLWIRFFGIVLGQVHGLLAGALSGVDLTTLDVSAHTN